MQVYPLLFDILLKSPPPSYPLKLDWFPFNLKRFPASLSNTGEEDNHMLTALPHSTVIFIGVQFISVASLCSYTPTNGCQIHYAGALNYIRTPARVSPDRKLVFVWLKGSVAGLNMTWAIVGLVSNWWQAFLLKLVRTLQKNLSPLLLSNWICTNTLSLWGNGFISECINFAIKHTVLTPHSIALSSALGHLKIYPVVQD